MNEEDVSLSDNDKVEEQDIPTKFWEEYCDSETLNKAEVLLRLPLVQQHISLLKKYDEMFKKVPDEILTHSFQSLFDDLIEYCLYTKGSKYD